MKMAKWGISKHQLRHHPMRPTKMTTHKKAPFPTKMEKRGIPDQKHRHPTRPSKTTNRKKAPFPTKMDKRGIMNHQLPFIHAVKDFAATNFKS